MNEISYLHDNVYTNQFHFCGDIVSIHFKIISNSFSKRTSSTCKCMFGKKSIEKINIYDLLFVALKIMRD